VSGNTYCSRGQRLLSIRELAGICNPLSGAFPTVILVVIRISNQRIKEAP